MSKEVAIKETSTQAAVYESRFTPEQIEASRLDKLPAIPDLDAMETHFVPINVDYWSPDKEGEEKRVYIAGVSDYEVPDKDTGEIKPLECVLMIEKQGDMLMRYINGSRVLVGNVKDAIKRQEIIPMSSMTPVKITYQGRKKTKNGNFAAKWSITPLVVSVQ